MIKLRYGNGEENTLNTTLFMQNTADMLSICTDVVENLKYFSLYKMDQFGTMGNFGLGFMQNLLANAIRLKQINDKLLALSKETEKTGKDNSDLQMFYTGVIIRMLLIFDPVSIDDTTMVTQGRRLLQSNEALEQKMPNLYLGFSSSSSVTELTEDQSTSTQLESYKSLKGMLNFTEGVIYGSDLVKNTTQLKSCLSILREDFIDRSTEIWTQTLSFQLFPVLFNLYGMMWSVNPLFTNCTQPPKDVKKVLLESFDDWWDLKAILLNLVYNYPHAIDTIRDVESFFNEEQTSLTSKDVYISGFGVGRLIYYVLNQNEMPKPVDPAEG